MNQENHETSLLECLEEEAKEAEQANELEEEHLLRITELVSDYKGAVKSRLSQEQDKKTRWSDRLADKIASFGGSWSFIVIFGLFLLVWMLWNTLSGKLKFDPPPFILLNLCLSFIAAFQAPVILMSQNRQEARDKHEAMIDFAINYKAEEENIEMQRQLKRIEDMLVKLVEDKEKQP
ncbi:DUF1003 domain-containing protein [Paenibacillus sp. sptzw28]|uniref:DUF1003 domain-containing protein n=1 Tax=Paenibacillus sp. sptzw28 TaxID=715179 RepID=UPI001C6E3500|nr:DUF1003 domain-containing protein [Paenibacillus sp. sptzw28]QYR19125.1 DUF1003 domain-containing protein [Paenibacillus sp. sptzw28]